MNDFIIKSEETSFYAKLFKQCAVEHTGEVHLLDAYELFLKSGLPSDDLKKICEYCGANKGYFDRSQFYKALKMISLAQAKVFVDENILKSNANHSLPRFDHKVNEASKTVQKSHELPSVSTKEHNVPPDASSRKRSLPYNCLHEPIHSKKRNTFSEYNKGITRMPESGPGTEINSRQDSNEKPPQEIIKKYLIFRDDELLMIQEKSKYGQIVFSICYDLSAKVLEVTVNYAKYLLGYGTKRRNHYYVKVMLKTKGCTQFMSTNSLSGVPDKNVTKISKNIKGSFRTTIKSDFCNPIFDESFKFTNVTPTVLKECHLQFIIKEETPKFLEKNLIIGCANFDLEEASLIEKHESIHEIIRDLTPFEQMEDKGKVVLSLEYNRHISKLCVCVMRVICGSEQLTDVSVEIFLRSIDSIIVSRKVELDYSLKNGSVESFSFDSCLLGSLCLVFVFSARIRNCSKTPFGRLIIGPIQFASGARLAHWTDICSGNKNVKMTHDII